MERSNLYREQFLSLEIFKHSQVRVDKNKIPTAGVQVRGC